VQFGFQFETLDKQAAEEPSAAQAPTPALRPVAIEKTDATLPAAASPAEPTPNEKSGGAEVVRLDRFRKK